LFGKIAAGGLDVHVVSGDHNSVVLEPRVGTWRSKCATPPKRIGGRQVTQQGALAGIPLAASRVMRKSILGQLKHGASYPCNTSSRSISLDQTSQPDSFPNHQPVRGAQMTFCSRLTNFHSATKEAPFRRHR
jgi:hypothetical protein